MNAVCLAVVLHARTLPQSGLDGSGTDAMDFFVLCTLGCLFFMISCIAVSAWWLWRRVHHPAPHVQLLMELEEEQAQTQLTAADADADSPPQPWEKPADWWQKSP
jgi:hypothetical protein